MRKILSVENSDDVFFSHRHIFTISSLSHLTDCPTFLFLNPKFSPKKFLNDLFLEFYQNLTFFLSKILMTFFLVIAPFFTIFFPSVFSYFTNDDSYSYCLHTIHSLYTHPQHAVFTFLHLALCSCNS